jgi:hypothetical protein
MSSARPNRSGPFLDLARDEVGEIFRSPSLRRDHRHAEALEALAPSRGLHRFFPRRLENLDRYDTVFVDSDTAISRLSFRWSEQQPEAFSDRTGKKKIYQRGGMIVRPALTPAKTFHDRDTEAWRIMEVSSGYFAETLAPGCAMVQVRQPPPQVDRPENPCCRKCSHTERCWRC